MERDETSQNNVQFIPQTGALTRLRYAPSLAFGPPEGIPALWSSLGLQSCNKRHNDHRSCTLRGETRQRSSARDGKQWREIAKAREYRPQSRSICFATAFLARGASSDRPTPIDDRVVADTCGTARLSGSRRDKASHVPEFSTGARRDVVHRMTTAGHSGSIR